MADFPSLVLDDRWIRSRRKEKNPYDPHRPYAWIAEEEYTRNGRVEPVGALFLSNRECPFTCLMCDLWKNTGDTVAPGDIPEQIAWGLAQLPPVRQIKLYNSGNFFDRKAIPPGDFPAIAELVSVFQTVIVESHPALIGDACLQFRDLLQTARLDVAIGLETVHPEVLARLNKRMDLDDFSRAIRFLRQHGMEARAFILLKPPFLDEREGVRWARRSIDFAFAAGVECCVVIPTRPGNGATDELMAQGYFGPPALESLEEVLDYGLGLGAGRVFADLWDLRLFSQCPACFDKRRERLQAMNLGQRSQPAVQCPVCRT